MSSADRRQSGSADRHHGGQEPPDRLQDSAAQNETYDQVVQGTRPSTPAVTREDMEVEPLEGADGMQIEEEEPPVSGHRPTDPDSRAERDVVAEVRRQQRRK